MRLDAEANQLRKKLAKAPARVVAGTEQLQALHANFCKVVLTARRLTAKVFGSVSECLGVNARTAVLETDPECPEWLWNDYILAPLGRDADGEAEDGEAAGAEEAAEAQPERWTWSGT